MLVACFLANTTHDPERHNVVCPMHMMTYPMPKWTINKLTLNYLLKDWVFNNKIINSQPVPRMIYSLIADLIKKELYFE